MFFNPQKRLRRNQFVQVKKEEGTIECKLKGPFHPLQFSLFSLHKIGSQKQIKVEPESVNSILLDHQPQDQVDQFLVGAQVNLTPTGNALMTRATTFMPNKLGLGAILTMLFAPKVELRLDSQKRRYIGCIAGLGHHSRQNETCVSYSDPGFSPFNPDHDMEIRFDATIDGQDIENLNQVRYLLNAALSKIPDKTEKVLKISVESCVVEYQDKIRKLMQNLLFKERKGKSKEFSVHEFKWGMLEGEKLDIGDEDYFLKLIEFVNLKDDILDRADEIISELRKLKRLANATPSSFLEQVSCPLCPDYQCFSQPHKAKAHLDSQLHKKNLIDLRNRIEQHE